MAFLGGILLVALGGVLEGLFSIPVTKVKTWEFENIWGVGSLLALLLLPWPLSYFFVDNLWQLYTSIPSSVLIGVVLCGFAWGLGGIYWGRAIANLGMALGVSILMGLINVFGSIVPLSVFEPNKLFTLGGYVLILAIIIMIVGIIIISIAGKKKEQALAIRESKVVENKKTGTFRLGLIFCLISGILSSAVNFAFIIGTPITEEAVNMLVPNYATSFAIWSLVFTANFSINTIYAFYMMFKKESLKKLSKGRFSREWIGAIFMGLAWPGGIIIYGIGANAMGPYGAYAGFPMMILASIIAGNLAGALGGEWKNSGVAPRRIMITGILVLCLAFSLLGYSTYMMNV
ncbi:L-rhamnose/proton symporter RhaT [uncultured Maribacter sp.]|uniref:L-rhamnose/proton symporter RhaT n=1 Tax=uncultured Maribacter sp. TaxID=431308 RepID=UPI0026183CE9|nr:L-rhamnose/proton symporter RhaT [uncultured Maribacter sp.]